MREIKFRQPVFNEDGSLRYWIYWGYIGGLFLPPEEQGDSYQYTGLKDKNGNEAYYDDIEDYKGCLWQIVWDKTYATTMLKKIRGDHPMKEIPRWNIVKGELIGNIYENPEFLKEAKQ